MKLQFPSRCDSCLKFLTVDKDLAIDESKFQLIKIMDRGSLKWPSNIVVESIIMVWKCFSIIEQNESLMEQFQQDLQGKYLSNYLYAH